MILSEIRYLVGIHAGLKGLPPTIVAPILNILKTLDTELDQIGFEAPPEILREVERLNHAMVLMNPMPVIEDDEEEDDEEQEPPDLGELYSGVDEDE